MTVCTEYTQTMITSALLTIGFILAITWLSMGLSVIGRKVNR